MIHLDFSKLRPVTTGAYRGHLSGQPNYIGGRLDGQLAPAEWQPYRRSESGQPLEDGQRPPDSHYVLFVADYLWHYVHTSLLLVDDDENSPGE